MWESIEAQIQASLTAVSHRTKLWQGWLREEILPQRHFKNRFLSTAVQCRNHHSSHSLLHGDPEIEQVWDWIQSQFQAPYAAREVVGGTHGDNRLGGKSILNCVVFGRVTGIFLVQGSPWLVVPSFPGRNDERFGDIRFTDRHWRISHVHWKRRSISFSAILLQRRWFGRNSRRVSGQFYE